ncbi:MAG: hypothetical protein QXJ50_03470 [Candidatus Woesearchaeota archaeon]
MNNPDSGDENNRIALFIFSLLLLIIVCLNFTFLYLSLPSQPLLGKTTTQIRLCVGPPSEVWFIYPQSWAVLNGTERIKIYATNLYSIDTVKNVSVFANLSLGLQYGDQQYGLGTIFFDGDSQYEMDLNTTTIPDANCRYTLVAQAESICEKKIALVRKISINNIDQPPIWSKYANQLTTNFSNFTSWVRIRDATIGIPDVGLINFSDSTLNFDAADLNSNVKIEHNNISVDTSAEPCLDVQAILEFYNLSFKAPKPMANGKNCPNSICKFLAYNNSTYIMRVYTFGIGERLFFSVAENMTPILKIFSDTDKYERFVLQNVTFYANFTTIGGIILNGSQYYCEASFEENNRYATPVRMSFNNASLLYEYTRSFTTTGIHNWTVTCYSPELEIQSLTKYSTFLITNRPPVLISPIPNITWLENRQFSGLYLNDYFADPDGEKLRYDSSPVPHIKVEISNSSMITLQPEYFWYGNQTVRFYAHDPAGLIAESNEVLLSVIHVPPKETSSGGGMSSSCIPLWNCTEWSPCLYSGIRLRNCIDLHNCSTNRSKPEEYSECLYEPSCYDLVKNNGEEGVDCGGPCPSCPSCSDLIKNGLETGVDCGGLCAPCPNCSDGIQNQGETGVDCGGPCQPCSKIEMPAQLSVVGSRQKGILIFFTLSLSAIILIGIAKVVARGVSSLNFMKTPAENPILTAEERALLHLEGISSNIAKNSIKKSAQQLSFAVRTFFQEGFGLRYEFTAQDLSRELEILPLSGEIKEAASKLYNIIEEMEFARFKASPQNLAKALKLSRDLIIKISQEAEKLNLKPDESSMKLHSPSAFRILELIEEGNRAAENSNLPLAREAYSKILTEYSILKEEEKKILKQKIIQLYNRIGGSRTGMARKDAHKHNLTAGIAAIMLLLIISGLIVANQRGLLGRRLSITGFEFICSGDICFNPVPSDMTFNQSENVTVYVYVTNPYDQNITFDTLVGNPLFSSIEKINNTCGRITFTPSNSDVGSHIVTISVKAENGVLLDQKQPTYTILNINDPPSITGWFPQNESVSIEENYTLGFMFNYTASDPDIPYGDYLTSEWYIDNNPFEYNKSAINYTTSFCDAGLHNITVMVRDSYNLNDSHSWTVNVTNLNRPPVLNGTIENQSWDEDSFLQNAFNLNRIFYDPDELECTDANKDNLTFRIELSNGSASAISMVVDENRNVLLSAASNWCGNQTVMVVASDSENETYSNNFKVSVNCLPDPPKLNPIGTQQLRAESQFVLYINASDPDIPYGDELNFSLNDTSLFNITTLSPIGIAVINFTPTNEQIGEYVIKIIVTDSDSFSDAEDVLFNISNNHAPIIEPISNQSVNETSTFTMQVLATDPDNDNITFSATSNNYFPSLYISSTGLMNFTLNQGDVGNHTVTIIATDVWGAYSNYSFNFEVININQKPELEELGTKRAKINKPFALIIRAFDPDIMCGDTLTFQLNDSSLFSLQYYNETAVMINFTPSEAQIGNYSFTINVSDAYGEHDSKQLNITIDYNFIPQILISEINATEGDNFYMNFSQYVLDLDNDPLNFSYVLLDDFPNFYLSQSGLMYFTLNKSDIGNHTINITVSDEENQSTKQLLFRVLPINNPPTLIPSDELIAYENTTFIIQINATDLENDPLEFIYTLLDSFPNFRMLSSGLINFTPNSTDIGTHMINITVREVLNYSRNDSKMFKITVKHKNNPPEIMEYAPINLTVLMYENESVTFTQHTVDPDFDNITYSWILDGVPNSTAENFTYAPGYFGSGVHLLQFIASDGENETSITWNITVLNVNRPPYFGIFYDTNFENNSYYQNLSFTHSVELALENSSQHYLKGALISRVLDLQEDNSNYPHFTINSAEYLGYVPSETSVQLYLRTSSDNTNWGAWTECNPECANLTSNRYVQYQLVLLTSRSEQTPVIEAVRINYTISNVTIPDNINLWWVYLGNFFKDDDLENLTYNYTMLSGVGFLNLTMSLNGRVQLIPLAEGHAVIKFSASDPEGANVESNAVNVTIKKISSPVPVPQNSGGGSTTVVFQQIPKEVPYSMNIIVPQPITIYKNETISIPIKIVNSGNITLNKISLDVTSENKNVTISISPELIERLNPGEEAGATVIITSYQMFGSYEVLVRAMVEDPRFNETNKIFINSLEKGTLDRKALDMRIAYTRDLLSQNSICLELNEFIKQAEADVEMGNYEKAARVLSSVVENCQYLISQKERIYQKPSTFSLKITRNFIIVASSLAVIFILTLSVVLYTRRKFK